MRLEIIIPDNTRQDVKSKLANLTERLSAHPELVEEIHFSGDNEDATIQRMFTPALLEEIDAADSEIDTGAFFTAEQLDEHFKRKTAEWEMQHQR